MNLDNDLALLWTVPGAAGVTGVGSCAGANPATTDIYVYRFSATAPDRTAPDPKVPPGGARTGYMHIVFTVPNKR